jgi:hypothetical protein
MRAIIMADGQQIRWTNSTIGTKLEGTPKQLLKINGETLLYRTVRLLQAYGIEDVWITTHNPDFSVVPGVKIFSPKDNTHCLDKLHACKPIWKKPTTMFLYGDCFYTSEAIDKIVNTPVIDRFLFFGRMHPSYYTGHSVHEISCKKIEDFDYLEECINWIKEYEPDYGGGWELYRRMCGVGLDKIREHIPYDHFISIDDFTDDFDEYEHYKLWLKRWENR